jgi:hypothetical protein
MAGVCWLLKFAPFVPFSRSVEEVSYSALCKALHKAEHQTGPSQPSDSDKLRTAIVTPPCWLTVTPYIFVSGQTVLVQLASRGNDSMCRINALPVCRSADPVRYEVLNAVLAQTSFPNFFVHILGRVLPFPPAGGAQHS